VDVELVRRAQRGDQGAYDALARASASRLFAVAHRIIRDTDGAEDAVQQTLVAMWTEIPRLRDPERFEAWTYRLVVRFSLAEARRRTPARIVGLDNLDGEPAHPDDSARLAARDLLARAFERLSPDHRAVVVLHHYLGLPLGEVADAVGIPYGTAGSRLHYAVRELRAAIGEDDALPVPGGQPA